MQCYEHLDKAIAYTDALKQMLNTGKTFRDKELVTRMTVLEASIDFPSLGRKTLARKIDEQGSGILEGKIRILHENLSLNTIEERKSANYQTFENALVKNFYNDFRPIIV